MIIPRMTESLILLWQVSRAVNLSTSRSLILLDEFGKGTATVSSVCCYGT